MVTIDNEARMQVRYPFEIDNMAQHYITTNLYYGFTSPSLWVLEKNYYYLLRNSVVKDFDHKYRYKPSYMSYDEYAVVNLDYLLMYVNNIFCAEEFDLSTVIVPSLNAIVTMCQDKFPVLDNSQLERVNW